jgi:hypothetical protein
MHIPLKTSVSLISVPVSKQKNVYLARLVVASDVQLPLIDRFRYSAGIARTSHLFLVGSNVASSL